MSKLLKLDKNTDEGVRYLLNDLLETGKVSAVFSLRKLNENGAVSYSLIADPGELDAGQGLARARSCGYPAL